MTIQELLTAMRRSWGWLVGCLGVGCAAAVLALMLLPSSYTATATVFVQLTTKGPSNPYEASQFVNSRVKSYPDLVEAPEVLQGVLKDTSLAWSAGTLARSIEAVNPVDSSLIRITATADSGPRAAQIANSAARHLASVVAKVEGGGGQAPVQLITAVPATPASSASSPNRVVTIGLGLLTGLALGLTIAVVRSQRRAAAV